MENNTILEPCPPDVRVRAFTLYNNTFHSFQSPSEEDGPDKDYFIICWPYHNDIDLNKLRNESGSNTLKLYDWIGRDYIKIHWSEYNKIYNVLSTMLKLGYSFKAQTKGQLLSFDPKKDGNDLLITREVIERKAIEQTKILLSMNLLDIIDYSFYEEWNYITEEGKSFCEKLNNDHPIHDDERIDDFRKWHIFKNYDTLTLKTIIVSKDE